jgi:hypothetical protein
METPNHLTKLSFSSGFLLFFALGLLLFQWILAGNPGEQPIEYNHAVHIESGLECTECHAGAQDQARATLPTLDTCLLCHSEPLTESPEEEKIVALAAAGQEAPWIQLTRVPGHVYFSHRRHVALGELECSQCHGPMETLTRPPERPFRALDMDDCMECHEQRSIRNDCNDCHR